MIKDKIKYFIRLSGKSQTELAQELDCSKYVIQTRITNGKNLPRVLSILNACNCDILIRERSTGIERIVTLEDYVDEKQEK